MDEIIEGIFVIVKNLKENNFKLQNAYKKLVRTNGNINSQYMISSTFKVKDDIWRGMGVVENSGLMLKEEFLQFDIESIYPISKQYIHANNGCKCGEVLKGKLRPNECTLFGKICTPENPVGPCMVSHEGTCSAYYKYKVF